MWKIEIRKNKDTTENEALKKAISEYGVKIKDCEISYIYYISGNILAPTVEKIAKNLLTDNIVECYEIISSDAPQPSTPDKTCHSIEVAYKPGVMDPVTESTIKAIRDIGIMSVSSVQTGKKYILHGNLTPKELNLITSKLLLNHTIQRTITSMKDLEVPSPTYNFSLVEIELVNATPDRLARISSQYTFTLAEIYAIQKHFQSIGRNPTDVELETISQTWSEHCIHKTFKSNISLNDNPVKPLFTLIKEVTESLSPDWCVSVFEDNAGIIKFNDKYNLCFKVETHNHPSAIEPYGGAGTGTGGVIRDILGTGLGAKPIMNTDIFCFAEPDFPPEHLPQGTLHPSKTMKGVISGVRDYGNRMGIPTTNGAVLFDNRYLGNPLVYCGTVGLIPKDKCKKTTVPGDLIVLLGGKTGRDGIHGVTFASVELTEKSEELSSGAVQIGNPITEKKVTDVLLKARDLDLYRDITDCGGGGLSSAIGEMAKKHGAEVDLDKIPLKYSGLSYREIWISEAQERMVVFVPRSKITDLLKLCFSESLEANVIGKVTNDHTLMLKYLGNTVAELNMEFLHKGVPLNIKPANWTAPKGVKFTEPKITERKDLSSQLCALLSMWNVCSKEWVIRQYDHEVQGGTVCKSIMGNGAPTDASVIRPLLNSDKGTVVGCGINPKYGDVDPYWMAASAVDEAIRNVVAVGANPDKIALLDNFCWGNPDKPDVLGSLTRAVQGCCDMAKAYAAPFISGKDSLYNEYRVGAKTTAIPGTLLISAIGIIDNVNNVVSSDIKEPDNSIYVIGKTYDELGGSHYYASQDAIGNKVPKVRPNPILLKKLHQAITSGFVKSCHDCSEGGIGVACAEMCFGNDIGMKISLGKVTLGEEISSNTKILFSESNTRFIVEVQKKYEQKFEEVMKGCDFSKIGTSTKKPELEVIGLKNTPVVKTAITKLKDSWQSPIKTHTAQFKTQLPETRKINYSSGSKANVIILRTAGTNCDMETAYAFEKVGAKTKLVHINELLYQGKKIKDYDILVLPGGFSYGDDISAGKILANELQHRLSDELNQFVSDKKLVLGICNGFQILVKLGLLPYGKLGEQTVTLTNNTSGLFQCEWVNLVAPDSRCIFTKGLKELDLPIAHAEGKFVGADKIIKTLQTNKQIALQYKSYNPNGSMNKIAGICDQSGRIFGLMPHPERFISNTQHPYWNRNKNIEPLGLRIFLNAVKYV
ncbi:MAG: phosphoribosylformylglycinamidine synthase subunit PurL [bacterium]|nr:phosphoribosylformylglycinamidine synthase subunit PurL [bacterium]